MTTPRSSGSINTNPEPSDMATSPATSKINTSVIEILRGRRFWRSTKTQST
jgi:hypothetical protein